MRSSVARGALVTAAVACMVLAAGCSNPFAPPGGGGGGGGDVEYKIRTTPENVLYNLRQAYEYMNAEEYLDCLAQGFTFHLSEDDWGGGGLPKTWDKLEETQIHNNMFSEDSDVEDIALILTEISTVFDPGESPTDPADDRWEHKEAVDLRVTVGGDLTYLATAPALFVLQRDIDQVGPNLEELWEVIDWYDLGDEGMRSFETGPQEQQVSIGALKALFR